VNRRKPIGESLLRSALIPRRIIAGPLARTWETAAIVASSINRPVNAIELDKALCEIDYGTWEGKSSDEIRGMGGGEELSAWENDGRWACKAWRSSRDAHFQALAVLIDDIRWRRASPVLVVSSNGVLRLLLQQLDLGLAIANLLCCQERHPHTDEIIMRKVIFAKIDMKAGFAMANSLRHVKVGNQLW
jgi:broad specificity phosphatase PhoE